MTFWVMTLRESSGWLPMKKFSVGHTTDDHKR